MLSNRRDKKTETQKNYFLRLRNDFNLKWSRTTLQLIEESMKDTDNQEDAYEKYKKLTRKRERNKKAKSNKATQISFSEEDIKTNASVNALDPQEDQMEKESEQARLEEKRLTIILTHAYPRLMAFIREHESRLSTDNDEHWITLKLDDAALLFLNEYDRMEMNRV